jgi:hypothetical protein
MNKRDTHDLYGNYIIMKSFETSMISLIFGLLLFFFVMKTFAPKHSINKNPFEEKEQTYLANNQSVIYDRIEQNFSCTTEQITLQKLLTENKS